MRAPDVVTVGEAMIMLVPDYGSRLADVDRCTVYVGGAESNVAISLAQMGLSVRWASVLRDEPLGHRIASELTRASVDVASVVWTDTEQTGVYFKDSGDEATSVYYYRRHSAARLLEPSLWKDERLRGARVLHLSGITPALSDSALETVGTAIFDNSARAEIVSFDVNYRPGLWSPRRAALTLKPLADAVDVLFVGLDEAEVLWGCTSAESVRELLPNAGVVVVKDGARGAHAFTAAGQVFVPSRRVEVIEPVGAGDAFAAGYISGILGGQTPTGSLRLGHLLAGAALSVYGDTAPPLPEAWLQGQLNLSEDEWLSEEFAFQGRSR